MKSIKDEIFPDERLVGLVGDVMPSSSLLRQWSHFLTKEYQQTVCLPLEIDARYLKNLIRCARLIDLSGLILHGQLCRHAAEFLSSLDPLAKLSGHLDLIVRRERVWKGFACYGRSLITLLKNRGLHPRKMRGLVLGSGQHLDQAVAALLISGVSSLSFVQEKKKNTPLHHRCERVPFREWMKKKGEIILLGNEVTTEQMRGLRHLLATPSDFQILIDVRSSDERKPVTKRRLSRIHHAEIQREFFNIGTVFLHENSPLFEEKYPLR